MRQLLIVFLTSITFVLCADIGKIESATGDMHVERLGKNIPDIKILKKMDTIVTGEDGKVKITLEGNIRISVGKNSMLLIDDYLLEGESSDLQSNFLNTITLRIEKISSERFKFNAKTAIIGIRRAEFLDSTTVECNSTMTINKQNSTLKIPNTDFGTLPYSILVKNNTGEIIYRKNDITDTERDLKIVSIVLKDSYILIVKNALDDVVFCRVIDKN